MTRRVHECRSTNSTLPNATQPEPKDLTRATFCAQKSPIYSTKKIPTLRGAVSAKDEEPYPLKSSSSLSFSPDDVIFKPPNVKILVWFGILSCHGFFGILKARISKGGHVAMPIAVILASLRRVMGNEAQMGRSSR